MRLLIAIVITYSLLSPSIPCNSTLLCVCLTIRRQRYCLLYYVFYLILFQLIEHKYSTTKRATHKPTIIPPPYSVCVCGGGKRNSRIARAIAATMLFHSIWCRSICGVQHKHCGRAHTSNRWPWKRSRPKISFFRCGSVVVNAFGPVKCYCRHECEWYFIRIHFLRSKLITIIVCFCSKSGHYLRVVVVCHRIVSCSDSMSSAQLNFIECICVEDSLITVPLSLIRSPRSNREKQKFIKSFVDDRNCTIYNCFFFRFDFALGAESAMWKLLDAIAKCTAGQNFWHRNSPETNYSRKNYNFIIVIENAH